MAPYAYPNGNKALIESLKLLKHPEGGYFVETGRWKETIPSPFAYGAERPMGTTIYYLLTAEESRGKIHRNLSQTMHVLHQGRATYTLVHPPKTPSEGPRVEHITMGTDAAAGEVRQLLVGDSWKMSEIPKEDLAKVAAGEISKDEVGCLITEVVVPGFDWHDHAFLTQGGLEELFKGRENGEKWVKELAPHIRQDN